MVEFCRDNAAENNVSQSSAWRLSTILLATILVSQVPRLYGYAALVTEGITREPFVFFLVFPLLSHMLMIAAVVATRAFAAETASVGYRVSKNTRSAIMGVIVLTIAVTLTHSLVQLVANRVAISASDGVFPATLTVGNVFLIIYTLQVVGMAPVIEEVFWRIRFQGGLQVLFGAPIAICIQSMLFAAIHMRGLAGSLELFFIGVIYGLWRWRKATLMPLIVAHILWNGLACAGLWRDELELRRITVREDYGLPLEILCRPKECVPADNAVRDYERAFTSFIGLPKGLNENDLDAWPGDVRPEKVTLLRRWIAANWNAMAQFEKAANKPYYCLPYSQMPMGLVRQPSLSGLKAMVLVTLSRAQLSAFDGNVPEFVADIMTCFRLSQHLAGPKPLAEQLMGAAIQQRAASTVVRVLARAEMDRTNLAQLQSALESTHRAGAPTVSFSGEQLICHALIQETFTEDSRGGGRVPRASIRSIVNPPRLLLRSGLRRRDNANKWKALDRKETIRLTNDLFAYLGSIEGCTPVEVRKKGMDVQAALQQIVDNNTFLGELTPRYARAYYSAYQSRALIDSLVMTAAILRYRMERGDPPGELDELVREGYIVMLPRDPYSGSSFVYRRTSEDFILYSLGPDFDDDRGARGGKRIREFDGDDVFWPPTDD